MVQLFNRTRKVEKQSQSRSRTILQLFFILITSAVLTGILLVAIEAFIRGGFSEARGWIVENKNPFLLNYLILYTLFLIFFGIFNDLLVSSFIFSIFICAIAVINKFKFMFLGDYLYPWDFLLYQQLFNLLPQLLSEVNLSLVALAGVGVVLAVILIIIIKRKVSFINFKLHLLTRIILLIASVGLLVSFFVFRSTPLNQLFTKLQIENRNWNQATNYRINGFLLSFVLNTESTIVFAPQGYGKDNIAEIVVNLQETLPPKRNGQVMPTLEQKPNIIFVMNEAFWDPTQMDTLKFSDDPMPNVRNNQSGWLLSPQFGGGTANIEFEALTGLNVSFLPAGSVAYQQFVSHPVPSLATVLEGQGYEPIAIHPYYKWFWSREKVYKHIGFNEFLSLDHFKEAVYRGPYIADQEVNKKIINKTEQTEKPVFIYAVTMQNHGPYEKNRYHKADVSVEGKLLSQESLDSIETYTQGVVEGDQAFGDLINYYKDSKEPTIIVFFGDHLPFLGADYLAYKEAGFINEGQGENWSLEEYNKMRTTPLVVWTNYLDKKTQLPTISPSFLAPEILDLAQLEKPLFYQFLQQFSKELPGFSDPVKNDPNGTLFKETPQQSKQMEDMYLRLQYDILFGKQHGIDELY